MKHIGYIQFFAVIAVFFAISMPVHAADAVADAKAVATVSASENTPVILPTNPFYFAKEIVRDVRRLFTFGKINKAEYELEVADQKALEVRELEKIDPKNTDALKKALDNYNDDVVRLKSRIESIQTVADDARVGKLIDTLAVQSIRHAELLDTLKQNDAMKDAVTITESAVRDAVTTAGALQMPGEAKVKIESAMTAMPLPGTPAYTAPTEIRAVQTVSAPIDAAKLQIETKGSGTLIIEPLSAQELNQALAR